MRLAQLLRQPEFHIFLCALLLLLSNWPFLGISAKHGLMSIYLYLFTLWALFILLLFLIQMTLKDDPSGKNGDDEGDR